VFFSVHGIAGFQNYVQNHRPFFGTTLVTGGYLKARTSLAEGTGMFFFSDLVIEARRDFIFNFSRER
jgi:hypothetical protein